MKKFILLILILLITGAFVYQKNIKKVDTRKKFTFWTIQLKPIYEKEINSIIINFERKHPDYKVIWVDIPIAEAQKRTLASILSSTPPDLVNLNPDFSVLLAQKNALEYLDAHDICYVTIKTSLKDYKKYLSNDVIETPLGRLIQAPNLSELKQDSFKVMSKQKPTVEQIEDAVFAWKVAKHISSRAIVIAKDLKTTAIAQGLQSASVEFALDYSCDMSKEAILASDLPLTAHDINVAAQGRISVIIVPDVSKDIIAAADKFNMSVITTGFTNILY